MSRFYYRRRGYLVQKSNLPILDTDTLSALMYRDLDIYGFIYSVIHNNMIFLTSLVLLFIVNYLQKIFLILDLTGIQHSSQISISSPYSLSETHEFVCLGVQSGFTQKSTFLFCLLNSRGRFLCPPYNSSVPHWSHRPGTTPCFLLLILY